jgi:predicted esterase
MAKREEGVLCWCEVTFAAGAGVTGTATVALPVAQAITRGVVVAHGGSDDGRRSFVSEATELAALGAAVILPVTRIRLSEGPDVFATDVKNAVLTQRAALDLLVQVGAPPGALCILGHSAGGAIAAILSAIEPRLARIAIFGNGAGPVARSTLAHQLAGGCPVTKELAAVTEWFDLGHFVGTERRAHLLVQHGRADRTVPTEAGRALFDAATGPKRWVQYECDHALDADPHAIKDRAEFIMATPPHY